MDAKSQSVRALFSSMHRYIVPAYQRPYVWDAERQWEPLWGDVERIADARLDDRQEQHFLGAIVIRLEHTEPGGITDWSVIDGQQRLTTLQVMIAAIADAARSDGYDAEARRFDKLVRHDDDDAQGDARFRFWPTTANQASYRSVMREGGPDPAAESDSSNNVDEAFAFFRAHAIDYVHEGGATDDDVVVRYAALREAITGLFQIVTISLDPDDPAQVIFETLNARGTPLLAMDLVKNAVFDAALRSGAVLDDLNDEVWAPQFSDEYWGTDVRVGRLTMPRSEVFLFHWLAMKLGEIIPADRLFEVFRQRILTEKGVDPESLLRKLVADAKIVRSFDEVDLATAKGRFFATLSVLDTTTMYPVALLLLRSEIDSGRVDKALDAISSYLVRRALIGLSSKSYTQLAARLIARAKANLSEADDAIIEELVLAAADNLRWPNDREVKDRLLQRPVYGLIGQPRIVLALTAFEMSRRSGKTPDTALPAKLEVEHLLPRAWEANWPLEDTSDEAVERRQAHVDLLGNLTLVAKPLNASMSNAAWVTKRAALNQHDVLLMNSHVQNIERWDEAAIDRRGEAITDVICARWPGPQHFLPGAEEVAGGELWPANAVTDPDDLRRVFEDGSDNLRTLLTSLAAHPGERRVIRHIEEEIGWPPHRIPGVMGAFARGEAARREKGLPNVDGRRPWHVNLDPAGAWWLWMDEEQAAVIAPLGTPEVELVLEMSGARANALLTWRGLTVLKGSIARPEAQPSVDAGTRELRDALIASGVLVRLDDGSGLEFSADHAFESPARAANVIVGRAANAQSAWRTADGATLAEIRGGQ